MKPRISGLKISALALCAVWQPQMNGYAQMTSTEQHLPRGEKEEAAAEALIRQRVNDWAKAIRGRDIDSAMSLYAPNIVSFDLDPPLQYAGTDNKRRAWQKFFAAYSGPITYEVRDLNITTHGELALVHSLNHVSGTLAGGHITDMWVRWTAFFQRIDGVWLVVHDHVSIPADLEHGQAVLNLKP
jgi:ketosteroid isomerase-like protein